MIRGFENYDDNTVQVLYFEYKTYTDQVFKIKRTDNGLKKLLKKQMNLIHLKMTTLKEYQDQLKYCTKVLK
jgi:hypothetical protein